MRPLDIVKRLVGLTKLERIALEIDERLPAAFKHRFVYGPAFVRWAAFLRESQYWDKEKLQAYQIEQLRNLLGHAMKSVPYYRKLFADHGFKPEAVQTFEDIRCLPYLDKETVRNRLHEFIAEGIPGKRLLKKPTSGSTGILLTVYKTKETNVNLTRRGRWRSWSGGTGQSAASPTSSPNTSRVRTAQRFSPRAPRPRRRRAAAAQVAALIHALRAARLSHGDLKATNILLSATGPVLVDLDAMRAHRSEAAFARAHAKDLERFMRNWEGNPDVMRLFAEALAK